MKKIKELKRKLASALIVALIGTSIAMPSFADAKNKRPIEIKGEKEVMTVGETQTLQASYASPSSASPAEATWEITGTEGAVVFTGGTIASPPEASPSDTSIKVPTSKVSIKANKPGKATITATVNGESKSYYVTVKSGARVKVTPTSKTIAYGGSTELKVTVENAPDNAVIDYQHKSITPEDGGLIESKPGDSGIDEENVFTYTSDEARGLWGKYQVQLSATIDGEEILVAPVTITVEAPVLKLAGDNKLDLNGHAIGTISYDKENSEYKNYTDFAWESSKPEVLEIATSSNASEIEIVAKKAGEATVKLTATGVNDPGPATTEPAKIIGTATMKVTVVDTREFQVYGDFVELDINPDEDFKHTSETLSVINDYGDTKIEVQKADGTDEKTDLSKVVTAKIGKNNDEIVISVPDDLKQVGVANVVVSSEAAGQKGIVRVIVKNSEIPLVVENDVKVDTTVPTIKTPKLPAKTEDGELIPDEVKAEIEAEIATKTADLINTVQAVLDSANSDPDYKETLKSAFDISDEAIKALAADNEISLNPGDTISVAPVQKLADVKVEARVVKNEDGTYSTEVVITSIEYDIELQISKKDATGAEYATQNIGNFDADVEFDIPMPLPSSIPEDANWVYVAHAQDSANDRILTASSDDKYTVHTAKSCSPFKLSNFRESLPTPTPTPSGNRRNGGGHGSSLSSGKWIQDNIGWWYKYYDGTWPANTWKSLLWNNSMQWYRFNPEGYMVTGWFTDVDGNKYFLHNISDGRQGMMYTGWNQIEGKWYYFRENVGGPLGSLTVNGVTPDGYTVDINGVAQGYPRQ